MARRGLHRSRDAVLAIVAVAGCVTPAAAVTPGRFRPLMPAAEAGGDRAAAAPSPPPWQRHSVVAHPQVDADGRMFHRVAPGETGIAIARAYGVSWGSIVSANGLSEPVTIRVGQKLLLPLPAPARSSVPPAASGAMSLEARARAFHINIDDLLTGTPPIAAPRAPSQRSARTPMLAAAVAPILPPTTLAPGFDGRFGWPLNGAVVARFGRTSDGRFSQGIDIAGAAAPIRAAAAGNVVFVGDGVPGFGGLILVDHGGGWISAYGHASAIAVRRGDAVERGTMLARTSGERDATLHFQLRQKRRPVDPLAYLTR